MVAVDPVTEAALNLLQSVPPQHRHRIASGLVGAFKSIWRDSWGPRLEYILYNAIAALLDCPSESLLDGFPAPERPEHHFVVDPNKWVFYAMDAYRMAGDDVLAEEYARLVLANSVGPDGTEYAPMRIAEARLTLGVVAARRGDLEQATTLGRSALRGTRKSLPSLLMVAGELDVELDRRYPNEPATTEFRDALRLVR